MRIFKLAAAAAIAGCLVAPSSAQAQTQQQALQPIELNQTLLDKWLVAAPAMARLAQSSAAPQTDDAARPHVEKICIEAGFQSPDQCGEVIGYVGMIVAACDRRSQTFRDPIAMMRRELARLAKDTALAPEAKAETIANLKEIIAAFPNGFPKEHLQLVTANRDRIFAALLPVSQP